MINMCYCPYLDICQLSQHSLLVIQLFFQVLFSRNGVLQHEMIEKVVVDSFWIGPSLVSIHVDSLLSRLLICGG